MIQLTLFLKWGSKVGSKYDADMAMTIAMRQVRKTGGKRNKVNMDPLFSMLSSKKK